MSVVLFIAALVLGIVLARKLGPALSRRAMVLSMMVAILGLSPLPLTDFDYIHRIIVHTLTALAVFSLTLPLERLIQQGRLLKGWKILLIVIVLAYGLLLEAKRVF